jgi:UDP-sulfoquinovose synthase
MRILNQFTETFTVSELAQRIAAAGRTLGLDEIRIQSVPNPRKEREQHYYNPAHTGLIQLGLEPNLMTDEVLAAMLEKVRAYADRIDPARIMPRVRWNSVAAAQ